MKIVTDSGADLPVEEAAALDIAVAPLFIQFPEGEIRSADIGHDAFYDRLEAMVPEIPTTAQPYFLTIGRIASSRSSSPVTEFSSGLPR